MDIVKIFATILTLSGMLLLIFACLAFMQGQGRLLGVDITQRGYTLLPFLLGVIFFGGGIYLFKGLTGSSRNR
ncbi:MAG: hypothetical protein KA783_04730 [Chitinophagales bacterium]|jgi:hypothetical protein|nr:hypothetical protein [Sphingobacteriales bacterium]MBP6665339.1 hypothetical protein [Chitinophagales bacterium]MBP7533728.1 hypothetical protein [Chitinophagales bacterium]